MKRVFERFCRGLKEVSTHQPLLCQPCGRADGWTGGQGLGGAAVLRPAHPTLGGLNGRLCL